MLNLTLQSRPDDTVRPVALQVNQGVQNLPQLSPEQLTALEQGIAATAKTGNLPMTMALIHARSIAKGRDPQQQSTRAAVIVSTALINLQKAKPADWETVATENGFTIEEITKHLPAVEAIHELTK